MIKIHITDKHPTVEGTPIIVCGNTGYKIQFSFDEEWAESIIKTARFVFKRDGKAAYIDVPFTGDIVDVPMLAEINQVLVGVYTDSLRTTTPARIACEYSIRCRSGEGIADPTPEELDRMVDLFNRVADQQEATFTAASDAAQAAAQAQEANTEAQEANTEAQEAAAAARECVGKSSKVLEMNTGGSITFWAGTTEEHEAIKDTLDPYTLCLITDDTKWQELTATLAEVLTRLTATETDATTARTLAEYCDEELDDLQTKVSRIPTYSLSKSNNKIILKGSDGSSSQVVDTTGMVREFNKYFEGGTTSYTTPDINAKIYTVTVVDSTHGSFASVAIDYMGVKDYGEPKIFSIPMNAAGSVRWCTLVASAGTNDKMTFRIDDSHTYLSHICGYY